MRRVLLGHLIACALVLPAAAQNAPGVTDTEIKIGQTMPYTGPSARRALQGKAEIAYMQMINDQGGVNGRKINLISVDDGYMPWRTGNETRKLIENDQVAFIFGSIGTPSELAVAHYLNERKIPQLFIGSGAYRWGADYKATPYTIGGVRPTFRVSARAYTRHVLAQNPNAKFCILYQDDDFGRDYVDGMRDVLGDTYATRVSEATYLRSDKTVAPQIEHLKAAGCDVLVSGTTPDFAIQVIRKLHDLGWKPTLMMSNVSTSLPVVLGPAGVENSIGMLSSAYAKDPTDPEWTDDPGMKDFKAWAAKYLPDADIRQTYVVEGYIAAATLVQVLKQAGDDLSRENIMRQAKNLRGLELPMLLPGIKVDTSPTDYHAIQQLQLMRWDGERWVRFGPVLTDEK